MNIERILNGNEVIEWTTESMRDRLALTLSHLVFEKFNWHQVEFRTFVKESLWIHDVAEFDFGGKIDSMPCPDEWLIKYLNSVRKNRESFLVIEDWMMGPEDPLITTEALPAVFYGKEVYYVIQDYDLNLTPNWRAMCTNQVPLFHAFVVQGSHLPEVGKELSEIELQGIARSVSHLIFGAYDGESYIVCESRAKQL